MLLKRSWHVWNCLSQPAVNGEAIAGRNRLRHCLPEFEGDDAIPPMHFNLNAQAGICTACECEFPGCEPTVAETVEPACRESRCCVERGHHTAAVKSASRDIKLAAGIAKIGRAGHGIKPAAVLRQLLTEPTHFGRECCALAANLTESALRQEHLQIGLRPIGEPQLDDRRIVAAGGKIGLVKCIVGKCAGNLGTINSKSELLRRFAARQPAAGATRHFAEHDILVVVGKALGHAV